MMKNLISLAVPFILLITACGKRHETAPSTPATSSTASTDPSKLQVSVTEKGFEPESVAVPSGKPVTIVFTRTTDNTCAKEVVLTMDDGKRIEKALPLNAPVELATTFPKAGTLSYACGMDMIKGTIVVQ